MVAEQVDPQRLVFVDEMGTHTSLYSLYAWSKRGERAYCSMPRNRGKNTTVLASMSLEGMGPALAVEGATTATVFEAYVEEVLVPSLRAGQIVVMDNLSAHKGECIRELVEARGCQLLYLPPYSPDLSPIEEAFSKIKGILRNAQARSREALIEAMGRALDAITPQDARGFFEHCGYCLLYQRCDRRCKEPFSTSTARSPSPYQLVTVMGIQAVFESSATTERFGRREPFRRGLPICPGLRGAAGS